MKEDPFDDAQNEHFLAFKDPVSTPELRATPVPNFLSWIVAVFSQISYQGFTEQFFPVFCLFRLSSRVCVCSGYYG